MVSALWGITLIPICWGTPGLPPNLPREPVGGPRHVSPDGRWGLEKGHQRPPARANLFFLPPDVGRCVCVFGAGCRFVGKSNSGAGGGATTGHCEGGNDTSITTGRSGPQNAATRRNTRREERVTVQGPIKKEEPDGMLHGGMHWKGGWPPPLPGTDPVTHALSLLSPLPPIEPQLYLLYPTSPRYPHQPPPPPSCPPLATPRTVASHNTAGTDTGIAGGTRHSRIANGREEGARAEGGKAGGHRGSHNPQPPQALLVPVPVLGTWWNDPGGA